MNRYKAFFQSSNGEYYEGRFAALEDVYEYANAHQYKVISVKTIE